MSWYFGSRPNGHCSVLGYSRGNNLPFERYSYTLAIQDGIVIVVIVQSIVGCICLCGKCTVLNRKPNCFTLLWSMIWLNCVFIFDWVRYKRLRQNSLPTTWRFVRSLYSFSSYLSHLQIACICFCSISPWCISPSKWGCQEVMTWHIVRYFNIHLWNPYLDHSMCTKYHI